MAWAWGGIALLSAALAAALVRLAQMRAKYEQRGLFMRWPIPKVSPREVDPVFEGTPLGPSRDTQVSFIAGFGVPGGISDLETWILCVLAKRAAAIFEFGTATGKTTYLLACNAPPGAFVTTLTLAPHQVAAYRHASGDTGHDRRAALRESVHATFYYTGTPEESRVRQLVGDSKSFDDHEHVGAYDLIFIDASHARSYVESDSAKALRMIRPGGLVLWHDYRGPWRARGVYHALNALSRRITLRHIAGTSLVFHRAPG